MMREATTAPENYAAKNGLTNSGLIPINASVDALAIVTAGLAKDVGDENSTLQKYAGLRRERPKQY